MSIPFRELIKDFTPEDHAYVARRAAELIAEELTLRDLRKARDLTQAEIARSLKIGQDHVSRLEKRSDMLISTLSHYVEAMGGSLKLVAEFPDRPPVTLKRLADVFGADKPARSRRKP